MKIRLLSLLMCACVITAVFSGCKSDKDGATVEETTEYNPYANVYGVNEITDPGSSLSPESAYVRGDRIYMPCMRNWDSDDSERTILSINYESGERHFEPYVSKIEGASLNRAKALPDGSIVFVEETYRENEKTEYIIKENSDGSTAFSIVMESSFYPSELRDVSRNFIKGITWDDEGNLYFLIGCGVSVFSADGDFLFAVSSPVPEAFARSGGKVALLQYDYGKKEYTLAYIDTATRRLGENVTIHGADDLDDDIVIFEKTPDDTSDYLHYLSTSVGLFGVRADGADEVINWANSGIAPSEVKNVIVLGGGKVFYANFDWAATTVRAYMLSAIPEYEVPRRIPISIACLESAGIMGQQLTGFATQFNMTNSKYMIKIIPYTDPQNSEMKGVDVLNNDLILGNIPDMFLFDFTSLRIWGFPIDNYESKGMFADLYEYINNDPDFPRDSLLKCTMTPFERDGKLFRFAYSLNIESLVCTTETAAKLGDWGIADFLDMAEDCASRGVSLLYAPTRNDFMAGLKNYITEFVDEANGTCTFESAEFLRLLKYIESLPETPYSSTEYDAYNFGYRDGSVLLRPFRMSQVSDLLYNKAAFGVQEVSELAFIGYPGGGDATITETSSFAISALSDKEVRDGAWEFIKFLMKDENNNSSYGEISALSANIDPVIEQLTRYHFIVSGYGWDAWGSGNTDREPPERYTREPEPGAFTTKFTQSDGDFAREYITSLEGTTPMDSKIRDIVYEESQIFLGGAKSAEETAKIIQNRVAIYLSESH